MKVNTEERAPYLVNRTPGQADDDAIIAKALDILEGRMKHPTTKFESVDHAKSFLKLKIGGNEAESFYALFLDAANGLIAMDEMFKGTVDQVAVPIREIAKAALKYNAISVVVSHNHPSGTALPSRPDMAMTKQCAMALDTLGIPLVDHIIVSGNSSYSFAEHGLL